MNAATLLGLAVGIDYSLFMVGRFREELAAGRPVADAVEETVRHAGRSIFFSGLAVLVGLLGLMVIPYMSMRSIGLGGSLVVFFSVLSALTLLPALLGVLGPRVNALRVFWRPDREGRFWRRWSTSVMRRPWPVLVATIALVLLLAWPMLRLSVDIPGATSLPTSTESRQGYDILAREFDPTHAVADRGRPHLGGRSRPALAGEPGPPDRLRARSWRRRDGVAGVTSIVNLPGLETAEQLGAYWDAVRAGPSTDDAAGGVSLWQGMLGAQQRKAALAPARADDRRRRRPLPRGAGGVADVGGGARPQRRHPRHAAAGGRAHLGRRRARRHAGLHRHPLLVLPVDRAVRHRGHRRRSSFCCCGASSSR